MFWLRYPWWRHLRNEYDAFPYPAQEDSEDIHYLTHPAPLERLRVICDFLRTHFVYDTPGHHPTLAFTPDTLLGPRDHLLVLDQDGVVGTIRYHFTGFLWPEKKEPIYLVDAFCVHPAHRGSGKGAALLHALHRYANRLGLTHALFLKEGPALPLLLSPLHSGVYYYRRCEPPALSHPYVTRLTSNQAHRWIQVYQQLRPTLLILSPPDAPNQQWFVYRSPKGTVLACIQDTHQCTPKGERMGWVTVWLETAVHTKALRVAAANAIAMAPHGFDWLWIMTVLPLEENNGWIKDGPFHWYSFQWTAPRPMGSYGIMN